MVDIVNTTKKKCGSEAFYLHKSLSFFQMKNVIIMLAVPIVGSVLLEPSINMLQSAIHFAVELPSRFSRPSRY